MWLPAWLPVAHDTGHRDALVLVTNIGPSADEGTVPWPAQTLPGRVPAGVNTPYGGFGGGRPCPSLHAVCRYPISPVVIRLRCGTGVLAGLGECGKERADSLSVLGGVPE